MQTLNAHQHNNIILTSNSTPTISLASTTSPATFAALIKPNSVNTVTLSLPQQKLQQTSEYLIIFLLDKIFTWKKKKFS